MDQNQTVSDNGSANIDDGANKSRGTCAKICIGWEKAKDGDGDGDGGGCDEQPTCWPYD